MCATMPWTISLTVPMWTKVSEYFILSSNICVFDLSITALALFVFVCPPHDLFQLSSCNICPCRQPHLFLLTKSSTTSFTTFACLILFVFFSCLFASHVHAITTIFFVLQLYTHACIQLHFCTQNIYQNHNIRMVHLILDQYVIIRLPEKVHQEMAKVKPCEEKNKVDIYFSESSNMQDCIHHCEKVGRSHRC